MRRSGKRRGPELMGLDSAMEVAQEQFDFLVLHAFDCRLGKLFPEKCEHCRRYKAIEQILMEPFKKP
jgi:hypothetical protein